MNSWKSSEFCAWAPPLTTFIIGTGSTWALEPPSQRYSGRSRVRRGCLGSRERDAENGVRTETCLRRSPVERDHRTVELALVPRVEPEHAVRDLTVDVGDGTGDAFAEPLHATVAKLDGLVLAGRGARGNGRGAERARLEADLDLDGRVAARVEDLPSVNVDDGAHADKTSLALLAVEDWTRRGERAASARPTA